MEVGNSIEDNDFEKTSYRQIECRYQHLNNNLQPYDYQTTSKNPSNQQSHQPRVDSTLSTQDLLKVLKKEFMSTVEIIQNMIEEEHFDSSGRSYICDVMRDAEERLKRLNEILFPKRHQHQQTLVPFKEKQHESEKYLQGSLNSSRKRSETSNQPNSQESDPNRKKDSTNDSASKDKKYTREIEQKLRQYQHDLENERTEKVEAFSRYDHLKEQYEKLLTDKNHLQMRFSKLAGDKLTENNPAIADLSDPYRHTKIGEVYSEVYDNEWTDAFEALTESGYDNREAIDTLRLTLLNVMQFCSKKSESLLKRTEEAVYILFEEYKATEQIIPSSLRHLTMPRKMSERWGKLVSQQSLNLDDILLQKKWKPKDHCPAKNNPKRQTIIKPNSTREEIANQLKKFRKEVAVSMVALVEKAYISASWDEGCIKDLKPFIRKCLLIGWMMVVQSPPMTFAEFKPNEELRKEMYKEYTTSGTHIDYVVWPALLLNQGGPIVGKGVAQGKKAKK